MKAVDTVCGMEIESEEAFATRQVKGQSFYFCSENSLQQFDAAPEKYTPAVPSATTGISDGARGPVRLELPVSGLGRSGGPALAQGFRSVLGVRKGDVDGATRRAAVE